MRSRFAAPSAIVAGLALVGWLGFAWSRARRAAPLDPGVIDLAVPSARDERTAAPLSVPPATANPSETDLAPQRAGLEGEQKLTGGLFVRFEGEGRPAPAADVYWFGEAELSGERWRDDLDELGMGLDFFERNGRHFVTGPDGMASVPSGPGRVQIVATTPTHFGMTTIHRKSGSDEPIELDLRAAFGVEVRVRDERSRAAVRDVVVVAACRQLPDSRVGARTDERGIARLFPLFREAEPLGTWYASLPGVFFDEIRVPLPMQERSEPLELLLAESTPARVRIVDSKGELRPLSGKLIIGWNDREGDAVEPRQVRITDGIANLTRIESGVELYVRAEFPDLPEKPTAVFRCESAKPARVDFDLPLAQKPTPARD